MQPGPLPLAAMKPEGALERPGERRTENGEQNARKRATDRLQYSALVRRPAGAFLNLLNLLYLLCGLRVAFWHVADVPGVQGELLPAGAWGSAPHLSYLPICQSSKIPFVPFVVLCVLCDSRVA